MRTLVVDDEMTTRIVLEEVLSEYGEVHSCGDGSEAVEAFRRSLDNGRPYDLICMDLLMPTMNGLEALERIREDERLRGRTGLQSARVIVTTAADDADTISKAFQGLCDAYIVKPVDPAELINLMYCLCPVEEDTRKPPAR